MCLFMIYAALPESPLLTNLTRLWNDKSTEMYQVDWEPPSNMNHFDLDHYELKFEKKKFRVDHTQTSKIISVTSEYGTPLNISLSAINTCGRQSSFSRSFPIHSTSAPVTNSSHQTSQNSHSSFIVATEILAIVVAVLVIIILTIILLAVCYKRKRLCQDESHHECKLWSNSCCHQ